MPGKLTIFLLLTLAASLSGQTPAETAGGASNLLLRFELHPRASALSGAYSALADDDGALFYNPAGLARLRKPGFSFYHAEWLEDIRMDYLGYAGYLSRNLGWGIGIEHMWMPGLTAKDNYGNTTGDFNVSSSLVQLGLAYRFFNTMSTGLEIKYFQDRLAEFTASGLAFDAGASVDAIPERLSFGLAIQNMGAKIQYNRAKQDIPLQYRGGVALSLIPKSLTITADAVKSIDTDMRYVYGAEYTFADVLSLRVGNRSTTDALLSPSFGMGLKLADSYNFDYAFQNIEDLGPTHRMGVQVAFGYAPEQAPTLPLVPPAVVRVAEKNKKLIVYWTKVPAASYYIYAKFENQSDWRRISSRPLKLNYMRFNLPRRPGIFRFYVTALRNGKESRPSKTVTYTNKSLGRVLSELRSISKPELVALKAKTGGRQVVLSWPAERSAKYRIYVWSVKAKKWLPLKSSLLPTNTYRFRKPEKLKSLKFKVNTVINGKERAYSEETTIGWH